MRKLLLLFCFGLLTALGWGQDAINGKLTAQAAACSKTNGAGVLTLPLRVSAGAANVTLSGTFAGTLSFMVSGDNGDTWVAANGFPPNSSTGASTTTSAGTWRFAVSGLTNICVYYSTYSSGTAIANIQASPTAASLSIGGGGSSGTVTVKSSGSLTDTAFVTGNGTTVVQTPSATSTLDSSGNASFPGTVTAASDGTHAGAVGLIGNTTVPTLGSNQFYRIGPNSASFTSWGIQDQATEPASAGIYHVGAASSHVAQGTVSALVASEIPAVTLATGTSVSLSAPSEIYVCTSTCTVTPPVPAAGYQFCVFNGDNVTTVITLAALGSSARYENQARTAYGTAGTGTLVMGGAAKDQVCLIGLDATHYLTVSVNGSATVN